MINPSTPSSSRNAELLSIDTICCELPLPIRGGFGFDMGRLGRGRRGGWMCVAVKGLGVCV